MGVENVHRVVQLEHEIKELRAENDRLRDCITAMTNEKTKLLEQLMLARTQNEHMLATIHKLYNDVRREQENR